MFALRSIAQKFQDEHEEEVDDDDEYLSCDDHDVEVEVKKTRAMTRLNHDNTKEFDLWNKEESFGRIVHELKTAAADGTKADAQDEGLSADVDVGASFTFQSQDPDSLSSAVKTTSFLFSQLVEDVEMLSRRHRISKEDRDRMERAELVESFHNHMRDALKQLSMENMSMRKLEGDFDSVESILNVGAEEYIASIRKLIKKEYEDTITVWYRGVRYEAIVPDRGTQDGKQKGYKTITNTCYDISAGAVVNGVKNLIERVKLHFGGRNNSQTTSRVVHGDYEALNSNGMVESTTATSYSSSSTSSASQMNHPILGYRRKPVLKDISGVLRHGRLTLVLGPPGASKTSYLRAISGHLHRQKGVNAKISGEIRFNHFLVEELKRLANWSMYCGQVDDHQALLTVRETFEFAWKCRKYARITNEKVKQIMVERIGQEAADRFQALTEVEVEFLLAVLGLTTCADTIIGNATLKGVSGGEKRRVTLGEMLVTGAQVCCLDEISTGLDSAATYDICKYLRSTAHFLGQVVVVALLQPPPEVIDLFDDIVLLAEGNVIYHGPREHVKSYFERLGYRCPPRKDLGDFLQELPTSTGAGFMMSDEERADIGAPVRPPRTADEFGQAWKQSKEGLKMNEEVAQEAQKQFEREEQLQRQSGSSRLTWDNMPENSPLREFGIVLNWAFTLRLRNKAQVMARVFQNVFMGIIFGTLFWQLGKDEWYLKAMLFGQLPGFMQAGSIGAVPQLVQERGVFYKQNAAKFYTGASFALAQFVVQIPFTIFDACVFGNLLYWMCGLVHEPYRYFMFLFLAALFGVMITQMMRVFAYSVRNQESALVAAVLAYLMFIIFSGQLATPDVIPSYLKWFFWLNPLAWVYRALAINEFKSDYYGKPGENECVFNMTFNGKVNQVKVPLRCGDFFLQNRQFETDEAYVWYTVWLLIGYTLLFLGLTIIVLTYVRFDREYAEPEEQQQQQQQEEVDIAPSIEHRVRIGEYGRSDSMKVSLKTLVFSDIWYSINLPATADRESTSVDLLKGVSGWALPGRMTALMGSSGAGKTTLLDVLADRKTTGVVRGHILVNGAPPDRRQFKKIVGYVEQFGVHSERATVYESLIFSATLRLPPRSQHNVEKFVKETMELLELDVIQDEITMSLSVEENKRLTIAVELVANPSILFADEPTSGLDARAAAIVMRSIQNVARSGRTVICTIHQPSIAVFSMFDDLLLMRRGGEVVYFGELGENSQNLIRYFESIPGTKPCPTGFNPATWMLEVIGAGTTSEKGDSTDFAAIYRRTKLAHGNLDRLKNEFGVPERWDEPLHTSSFLQSPMLLQQNSSSQHNLLSPKNGIDAGATRRTSLRFGQNASSSSSSSSSLSSAATGVSGSHASSSMESGFLQNGTEMLESGEEGDQVREIVRTNSMVFGNEMTTPLRRKYFRQKQQSFLMKQRESESAVIPVTTQPFHAQVRMLFRRSRNTYWRSPEFALSRLLVILLVALIITATFWQQKYHSAADTQSRISSIAFMMMLAGAFNLYTIMPFMIKQRALFYREVASGMYRPLAVTLSDIIVEIPYLIAETVIGVNMVYFGVGFREDMWAYLYYNMMFFLYIMLMTCLGMFFAALMPDALSAQLIATVCIQIFQLFAGVIVPFDKLPWDGFKAFYYFSAQQWLQEGIITSQFHDDHTKICDPSGIPITGAPLEKLNNKFCSNTGEFHWADFISHKFTGVVKTAEDFVFNRPDSFLHGYSYDRIYLDAAVLLIWIVCLRIGTTLVVVFIDHNKR